MPDLEPNQSKEPQSPDTKVNGVLNGLHKNYMLVGNPHIKTWHGLLVLGVAVGLVAGVFLIANRDGRMEPVVETLPLPTIVIPPAENSAGVTNWLIAYPFHDSQGKQQIFTIRLDGTEKRQLTFLGDNGLPSWMPDGKRMVFTSVRTNSTTKRDEIGAWIMNADGSNQRQILPNVIAADISPDVTKLTYVNAAASRAAIWASDIDGTNPRQLTFPEEGVSMIHPTWSHDGTRGPPAPATGFLTPPPPPPRRRAPLPPSCHPPHPHQPGAALPPVLDRREATRPVREQARVPS